MSHSRSSRSLLNGWPLLGLLSAVLVVMTLAIVAAHRFDVDGVRMAIRATARTSFVLFALAFSASALLALWPGAWTRWQRRNRRQLGLAFAVSHGLHGLAILAFARLDPAEFMAATSLASYLTGGIAYLFIAAMAATSFDRTAAWLGPRGWRVLHGVGGYYLVITFLISNGKRIGISPYYGLPVAILAVVLLLRLLAWRRKAALRPAAARS